MRKGHGAADARVAAACVVRCVYICHFCSTHQLLKSTVMLDLSLPLWHLVAPPGRGSLLIIRSLCSRLHLSQAALLPRAAASI